MPTYIYESDSAAPGTEAERFELRQSMKDTAYTHHPETGQAIHRVITAGFSPIGAKRSIETIHLSRPAGEH